nr:hypothetical protein pmam_321 [Pithovirus mammoth]
MSEEQFTSEWSFWKEKCRFEFGISDKYFDFPILQEPRRMISGKERYNEICNKFLLSSSCRTFLDRKHQQVTGIYESCRGVFEAVQRNSTLSLDIFLSNLKEQTQDQLRNILEKGQLYYFGLRKFRNSAMLKLISFLYPNSPPVISDSNGKVYQPSQWELYVESLEQMKQFGPRLKSSSYPFTQKQLSEALLYLISVGCGFALEQGIEEMEAEWISVEELFSACLKSGDVSLVERMFPYREKLGLPINGNNLSDLQKPSEVETLNVDYFYSAIYGGNPILVNYLLNHSNVPKLILSGNLFDGMKIHPNPEGYFEITEKLLRLDSNLEFWAQVDDVDILTLVYRKIIQKEEFAKLVVERHFGNVSILLTFLNLLGKRRPQMDKEIRKLYPLSGILFKSFIAK